MSGVSRSSFAEDYSLRTSRSFQPTCAVIVSPVLEYGLHASSPCLRQDIYLLERIRRLVTRMFKSIGVSAYEGRVRRLNMFRFERCRLC